MYQIFCTLNCNKVRVYIHINAIMHTIIVEVVFITAMIICFNKTNYKCLISKITLNNLCDNRLLLKRCRKQEVGVAKHTLTLLHWDLRPLQFSKTKNKDPLWITKTWITKTFDHLQISKTKTLQTPLQISKTKNKDPLWFSKLNIRAKFGHSRQSLFRKM